MFERVPAPLGVRGGRQLQHPCGLGARCGQGQRWGAAAVACVGAGGSAGPCSGLSRSPAFLGTDIGVKRKWGGKSVFCFFSVLQITVKSCPLPPGRPRPGSPAKETAPASGTCRLSPRGTCHVSPNGVCHVPPSRLHHVPLSRMCCTSLSRRCHMSPEGTCQAPMPVPRGAGAGAAGWPPAGGPAPWVLLRSHWGHPALEGGGRRCPCSRAPRGAGAHNGALGWGVCVPPSLAGCRGGELLAPTAPHCIPLHPTASHRPSWERCRRAGGGPAQAAVTPRGCCGAGGAVPTTRPPPHCPGGQPRGPSPPQGHPAQSHPINQGWGWGEPPQHGHPGGRGGCAGEGARR